MKHATILTLVLFCACAGSYAQKTKGNAAMPAVNLPYTVTYSSQWAMGNPALAKRVLDEYHHYQTAESGDPNFMADTVTMVADGKVLRGLEQVAGAFTQSRSALSAVQFTPSAVLSVRSTDRNEEWVSVWGTQKSTMTNNSEVSINFNHIWRFNKDGKVDYVEMFEAKTPQQ